MFYGVNQYNSEKDFKKTALFPFQMMKENPAHSVQNNSLRNFYYSNTRYLYSLKPISKL